MFHVKRWDVIVVGAGHAGAEAAMASSGMGMETLLITQNLDTMCQMSCNPSVGGVAKGQIVREIDALGGYTGIVADQSTLQFRMLNLSKGPAMWSPRAQCDKWLFSWKWREVLENASCLSLWQDEVVDIIVSGGAVQGVRTRMNLELHAKAIVLTNGTFLNGKIHAGEVSFLGGRIGEKASEGLSEKLACLGFKVAKLKTGTPMRIDGRTINFSRMVEQPGDAHPGKFSFSDTKSPVHQLPCYLAYTNEKTHEILRRGFDRSPMFTGRIQGRGPRYCPSIEDKIERFSGKDRHQLFVEPEGWKTRSYYLNGFSSSLPLEVQYEALCSIEGFERAHIFKPGYAIEYDYFPPTQLAYTLETQLVENLYFAGQINGTTGYEEAACQGLMAGINAALKIRGERPFVLSRAQAYIGVLIDDLVSKGVDEPYRMFTSRAEHRILLRQDNADERLTPLGHALGLASDERMRRVEEKARRAKELTLVLQDVSVQPSEVNAILCDKGSPSIGQKAKLAGLLLRPEIGMEDLVPVSPVLREELASMPEALRNEVSAGVEIQLKYARYIEKERGVAERLLKFESLRLPPDLDYFSLSALSYEAREKLTRLRPLTIGQASRISGVSPADVSVLVVFLGQGRG
ncbi:MAG: tRNA uridine-5-carboxymethylaminomethyl(34) synthesis enzyme MnmG [Bacteroidales bacterium]|nr:tRNA uridine-5-carboxymethylaminomethyl(34) synthesis enzyme MnmG [Bacteroidales bacterium]